MPSGSCQMFGRFYRETEKHIEIGKYPTRKAPVNYETWDPSYKWNWESYVHMFGAHCDLPLYFVSGTGNFQAYLYTSGTTSTTTDEKKFVAVFC